MNYSKLTNRAFVAILRMWDFAVEDISVDEPTRDMLLLVIAKCLTHHSRNDLFRQAEWLVFSLHFNYDVTQYPAIGLVAVVRVWWFGTCVR